MDIVDPDTRSRMMRSVRQRDTAPEVRLRKVLHRLGLRYRLNRNDLPGTPDIVFPGAKCVVFLHGCFWHSHDCRYGTVPSTRRDFWEAKFSANRKRDAKVLLELVTAGWRVMTVWECALKTDTATVSAAEAVVDWVDSGAAVSSVPSEGGLREARRTLAMGRCTP